MADLIDLNSVASVNPVIKKKIGLFGSTSLMTRRFVVGTRAADALYDGPQFGAQTQGVVPLLYGELLIDGNVVDGGVSQSALDPTRILKNFKVLLSDGSTEGMGDDPLTKTYVNCKPVKDGDGKANFGDILLTSALAATVGQGIPFLLDKLIPKPKAVVTDVDPKTGEKIKSLENKTNTKLATLKDVDLSVLCDKHIMYFDAATAKWKAKHLNDLLKEAGMTVSGESSGGSGGGCCCCVEDDGTTPAAQCSNVSRDNTSNMVPPSNCASGSGQGVLLPHEGANKVYKLPVPSGNTSGMRLHFLSQGLYSKSKFNTNKAAGNATTQSDGSLTGAFKDGASTAPDQDSATNGTVTFQWCLYGGGKQIDQGTVAITGFSEGYVSRSAEVLWSTSKAAACIALSSEDYMKSGQNMELRLERMDAKSSCCAFFQGYDPIPGDGWNSTLVATYPGVQLPNAGRTMIVDDGKDPQIKAAGGNMSADSCPADTSTGNAKADCCAKQAEAGSGGSGGSTGTFDLKIPDAPECNQGTTPTDPPTDADGQTVPEKNKETGDAIKTVKKSFGSGLRDLFTGIAGAVVGGMLTQFFMPRTSTTNITIPADAVGDEARLAFLYKGVIVKVPNNYNGTTRVYTGEWDGITFKEEWTNDPAWCLLDYITNKRYGAGDDIRMDPAYLPTFYQQLYKLSKRNSEQVTNGIGATEPRYSLNCYFTGEESKWEAIQSMAASCHAQFIWSGTNMIIYQDRPDTPKMLVNQTNVVKDSFSFSGGSVKSVYNSAKVVYNNPNKFYRQDQTTVDDVDAIAEQGIKETNDVAFGCVSEAQAVRHGKWLIETEKSDPLLIAYTAGWDHYRLNPGDLVLIEDDILSENAPSGRVKTAGGSVITVDRDVSGFLPNSYIYAMRDDGSIYSSKIISVSGKQVIVTNTITGTISPGVVFNIATPENAAYFRIMSKSETELGTYDVTAIRHYPDKYSRIDAPFTLGVGNAPITTTP